MGMNGYKDYVIERLREVIIDALEWNIGNPADPRWRIKALDIMGEFDYHDCLSSDATNPYWRGGK